MSSHSTLTVSQLFHVLQRQQSLQHCGYKPVNSSPFRWVTPPGFFFCLGILMVGFFVFYPLSGCSSDPLSMLSCWYYMPVTHALHPSFCTSFMNLTSLPQNVIWVEPHFVNTETHLCTHREARGPFFLQFHFESWMECVCMLCFLAEWHRFSSLLLLNLALLMSHQHQTACEMRWRKHLDKHALIRRPNVYQ